MTEKVYDSEQKLVADAGASSALTSFILSVIGFAMSFSGFSGSIIAGISLHFVKKSDFEGPVTKNPHKIFRRIAKPLSIFSLVFGIFMTLVYIAYGVIIGILIANGEDIANFTVDLVEKIINFFESL